MDVIIDGYNLIGSEYGLHGDLEGRRNRLLQQLSRYREAKGFSLTVVFDGWRSGALDQSEEHRDGLIVIYSRQGEKADSVIVRVARQKGSGCVVVSSDREIRNAVEKFGATGIYAGEFQRILRAMENPVFEEDEGAFDGRRDKRGNPRQLSRSERNRREKLKKLRV